MGCRCRFRFRCRCHGAARDGCPRVKHRQYRASVPPISYRASLPPISSRSSVPPVSSRASLPPVSYRASVPPISYRASLPPNSYRASVPPNSYRDSLFLTDTPYFLPHFRLYSVSRYSIFLTTFSFIFSQQGYLVKWAWYILHRGFLVPNFINLNIFGRNWVPKNLYEIFAKPI